MVSDPHKPDEGRVACQQLRFWISHTVSHLFPYIHSLLMCCSGVSQAPFFFWPHTQNPSGRNIITQEPTIATEECPTSVVTPLHSAFNLCVLPREKTRGCLYCSTEWRRLLSVPVMPSYFSQLLPATSCQSRMIGRQMLLSVCLAEGLYGFLPLWPDKVK